MIYVTIAYGQNLRQPNLMEAVKTIKLRLYTEPETELQFQEMAERYALACNFVSDFVFSNGFPLSVNSLHKKLYQEIRLRFGLKAQLSQSTLKTVTARYKTIGEQLRQHPYRYQDEKGKWQYIQKTLDWLYKPVVFRRPQADLVRNRDYSFVEKGQRISINTLGKRVKLRYSIPEYYRQFFDGTWSFGTAKLVSLKGIWYLHISAKKTEATTFDKSRPAHVVGVDRGLRFVVTTYDETGECCFAKGKDILKKRSTFLQVRAELQSKGTKSAKRKLKSISGRENRWMADVNHRLSKALVNKYGSNTLFVLEDLTGVSFDEGNLSSRTKGQHNEVRSWAFYQLEQFLKYKAESSGSAVIKVASDYTSQRCPKCGRIHKENRHRKTHEYICDSCGYRSNDDRVGAMNIHELGTMYVSGKRKPRFVKRKTG